MNTSRRGLPRNPASSFLPARVSRCTFSLWDVYSCSRCETQTDYLKFEADGKSGHGYKTETRSLKSPFYLTDTSLVSPPPPPPGRDGERSGNDVTIDILKLVSYGVWRGVTTTSANAHKTIAPISYKCPKKQIV